MFVCVQYQPSYFHEDVPIKNLIGGEFRQRLFHLLSVECHTKIISVPVALDYASVCERGRESGVESGEKRPAKRSRSETPAPFEDWSVPLMRFSRIQIVTSTRLAQRNGRGRQGEGADRKPVERANRVLVTAC